MALETLVGVKEIDGVKILQERALDEQGAVDWKKTDELRKEAPIFVDQEVNMISFRIQNGPIKEVGVNGCQVTDMLKVAKHIIEKLNEKFPCPHNGETLHHLGLALQHQAARTKDREARNVEGLSKL